MRIIVLMGLKHSGKSSQARRLASHFHCNFFDLDEIILSRNSSYPGIRELYRDRGLEWFSAAEVHALDSLPSDRFMVIATGGGSMENQDLMKRLENREKYQTVFIDVAEDLLWERIAAGGIPPFLEGGDPRENFRQVYFRRRTKALETSEVVVSAGDESKTAVMRRILSLIGPQLH